MLSMLILYVSFWAAAVLADAVLKRTPLVRLSAPAGKTIFGGVVLVLAAGAALFAAFFVLAPLVNAHVAWSTGDGYPIALGMGGFLIIVSMLAGWCWSRTKWVWDEQGISAFAGPSETRLAWDEISEVSVSPWTWKVSGYGRDIVWTRYTLGSNVLVEALRSRRPDLAASLGR